MTPPAPRFACRHHHPAVTATLVLLFWLAAAVLVVAAQVEIDPLAPTGGTAAAIGALFATAWAYSRFVARHAGITHALGVGIAWLVLSIVAEIALGTRLGQGWFTLLGSPDRPLLRNVFLFAWIFAPAFYARHETVPALRNN